MGFNEDSPLETLDYQQTIVRKHAYRIRNYLYQLPDETKSEPKPQPEEKIEQMIQYETETANILAEVLATLPKLGKGE